MIAKITNDKTICIYDKTQFDWHAIRNCGQIFCDPPCTITETTDKIVITATGNTTAKYLWNYFDLDTDYNEIKRDLSQFKSLAEPIKAGGGIRILRQPFVETVVSFIISANNNIKRFSKTISQIAKRGFSLDALSQITEAEFAAIGCGYRAPYLVKTIRMLKDINIADLRELDNEALRKSLMTLAGVGRKVADCIMLFTGELHRIDITPVDTWIHKALEQLGTDAHAITGHRYAGVAQQYIFYYMQHLHKELNA